ncbi:hypothetical protein Arub01_39160 [Actinomadura rubrobrunea]|uniref:Uncharacterized protein n=1 Tax=Actinomadura rubrobrunea TaxID=115335 RepID=A0A9W6UXW9_9ACTN|nr:hypothetical protein Arub01_39160 [Actinomadura rubrobrunea]
MNEPKRTGETRHRTANVAHNAALRSLRIQRAGAARITLGIADRPEKGDRPGSAGN